jgi:hypothetical protein
MLDSRIGSSHQPTRAFGNWTAASNPRLRSHPTRTTGRGPNSSHGPIASEKLLAIAEYQIV